VSAGGRRVTVRFEEIAFGTADYARSRRLREDVLRRPLGLSLTEGDVAGEEAQWHFGLFDSDDRLLACAIAMPLSSTEARIRQMAVDPAHQNEGLGRRMMTDLESNLRARGFRHLALSARSAALAFYEKLGFVAEGDAYVSMTVPHFSMVKSI
jgi:predicted GNAT family N-acyltransferase